MPNRDGNCFLKPKCYWSKEKFQLQCQTLPFPIHSSVIVGPVHIIIIIIRVIVWLGRLSWLAGWGPPPSLTPHSATGKLLICIYVCRVNRFIQCSSHRWVGGTLASSSRQRTMASQVRWTGREYIVRNPFRQSIICMWGREHVSQSSLCVIYIVKESWGFPTPGIRIACANAVSFYRMNKKIVALC